MASPAPKRVADRKVPMKVDRNAPVRSTRSVAQAAYARRVEAAGGVASNESVGPSASVLGIPEAEFTPRVRDAIMGLMSEVDSLRRELGDTRKRLDEVEKAADQDGLLPLLNRRRSEERRVGKGWRRRWWPETDNISS